MRSVTKAGAGGVKKVTDTFTDLGLAMKSLPIQQVVEAQSQRITELEIEIENLRRQFGTMRIVGLVTLVLALIAVAGVIWVAI